MDGVNKMHRRVTSEDVEDYSSHIPKNLVTLDQEEDIVYREGVLTHSEGVSTVKMMQQVKIEPLSGCCSICQSVLQDDSSNVDIVGSDVSGAESGRRKKREDMMSTFSEFPEEQNSFNSDKNEEEGIRMDEEPSYDDTVDIDYIEASGTYSLDLIRQRRVLRHERSAAVNHLELPEAMESTLMAHIDLSEYPVVE